MTQALLNKLSATLEQTVSLSDKMPKKEGMDFGKIFESKTNDFNSQYKSAQNVQNKTNELSNKKNDKIQYSKNDSSNDKKSENANTSSKSDVTKKQDNKSNDKLQKTASQAEKKTEVNENTKTNNTDEENTITEDDLNITDETTTITDEDPTMYNKLNTLEDPTTMLLLQTQIQKNINNCLELEQADEFIENNIVFKTGEENISLNNIVSKQFDAVIQKEAGATQIAQNVTPKEVSQQKGAETKLADVISENILKELNVEVISAQSTEAETSFSDLMQNQSPQEQAARVMIQGDVKYEAVASKTLENAQVKPTTITPSKIIEQISKQLDGMVNNSKLNMVLNPGSLGKVNVQIMNTKDGLMAQFTVTNQDVKDILMKGLDGLKESLLAQGVSVDNVSVKLEETDGEYNLDYTEQEGSRGGNKHQGTKQQKENEENFEELIGANVEEEKSEV